jgi:hypothetical protein
LKKLIIFENIIIILLKLLINLLKITKLFLNYILYIKHKFLFLNTFEYILNKRLFHGYSLSKTNEIRMKNYICIIDLRILLFEQVLTYSTFIKITIIKFISFKIEIQLTNKANHRI